MVILEKNSCVCIGFFQKTYKYSGTLLLSFEQQWESSLLQSKILITEIDGLPVPWFVCEDGISIVGPKTALIDLEWIDDDNAAKKLCGKRVCLEKNSVLKPIYEFPASGWIDYSLEEYMKGYIGKITGEDNYSGNMVLTVETKNGTLLIPYHPDFVINADHPMKTLTLKLPEGLI